MGVLPKSLQAITFVRHSHEQTPIANPPSCCCKYMYVTNYQQDVNTFDGVTEKRFGSSCKQLVLLETHTRTTAIQPNLTFVYGCRRELCQSHLPCFVCLFVCFLFVCLFVCFRQENYINGCSLSKAASFLI